MSQADLAGAAGVDVKTIGNLESRGSWPIARTRARIEAALGWPSGTLDQLRNNSTHVNLNGGQSVESYTDPDEAAIWALRRLSEETRRALIAYLRQLPGR